MTWFSWKKRKISKSDSWEQKGGLISKAASLCFPSFHYYSIRAKKGLAALTQLQLHCTEKGRGMVERKNSLFTDWGTEKKIERTGAIWSTFRSAWSFGQKQADSHPQVQQGQLQVGMTGWDVSQGAVKPPNVSLPHFSVYIWPPMCTWEEGRWCCYIH